MDEPTATELNDLLGVHQSDSETLPKQAVTAPEEVDEEEEETEEEESDSSDDEDIDEEESEASDDEEPETPEEDEEKLSERAKLTRAIKAERSERKLERERYQTSLKQYEALIADPDFLAHQYQKIQNEREQGVTTPAAVQVEIPNAPAYPNTPLGQQRLEADQKQATELLPEVLDNDDLRGMVEYQVSKGKTYIEAVQGIKKTLGLKSADFKREGAGDKANSIAKKTRMSTELKPRSGTQTSAQVLTKRMNSENRTVRERATAEALGLV